VRKLQISLCACLFSLVICKAQQPNIPVVKDTLVQETDSVPTITKGNTLVIPDSLLIQREVMNPLGPSKAAFYSAVLPGLGQLYNKRYWKVPIVWGALGGSIYMYTRSNTSYQRFRTAFKRRQAGFFDDEFNGEGRFPFFEPNVLENQQERFQQDRDLWLVATIALYILNIVEANVDAHLKQFNIDDDLSFDFQPYLDLDPITNSPNYGMAVTIKF